MARVIHAWHWLIWKAGLLPDETYFDLYGWPEKPAD